MSLKRVVFTVFIGLVLTTSAIAQNQGHPELPGAELNKPFKPFRIIGNIFYVGTNDLACYLIVSSKGLILLDTAYAESGTIIRRNISELGFKLSDIKIILSSHAHYDHVAGHASMKRDTGARVFASAADASILESGGTKSFFPLIPFERVKVDRILKDGDEVRLGDVTMVDHLTPGHTEGNTTWTTTVQINGKQYGVVFVASMSINNGVHLLANQNWPGVADAYERSFRMLKGLPCDIFLGPHAHFFNMEQKVAQIGGDRNPFIDPTGYQKYVETYEQLYREQLKKEEASLAPR